MPIEGGPWLLMATFCEYLIEDKRGVLSVLGMVDRVRVEARGAGIPDTLPPIDFKGKLVLRFVAGKAIGRGTVRIDIETPDGLNHPGPSFGITFAAPAYGVQRVIDIRMPLVMEGIYWFTVWLDEQRMAQLPLHVVYEPEVTGTPAEPE
jgi:hypothetical protein